MATVMLGAVGTSIGGPIGGAIGAALGSWIDQMIIADMTDSQVRSEYGTVQAQGAEGGAQIWRSHGSASRVPGNIFWVGNRNPERVTQRFGKRGEVVTTTWYLGATVGFSRHLPGNMSEVERVFVDGQLLYDGRAPLSRDIYLSTGKNQGSRDLSQPSTTFLPVSLTFDPSNPNFSSSAGWYVDEPVFDALTVSSSAGFAFSGNNQRFTTITCDSPHGLANGELGNVYIELATGSNVAREVFALSPTQLLMTTNTRWLSLQPADFPVEIRIARWERLCNVSAWDGFFPSRGDLVLQDLGTGGTLTYPSGILQSGRFRNDISGVRLYTGNSSRSGTVRSDVPARFTQTRDLWNLWLLENGAQDASFPYKESRLAGGEGASDQEPIDTLVAEVGERVVPGFRDTAVFHVDRLNVSSTGNRLGNFEAIINCDDEYVAEVVQAICEFHGVPPAECDVGALGGVCRGYAYAGAVPGLQALAQMMTAYDIVAQESANGLRFRHYTSPDEITIDEVAWIRGDRDLALRIDDAGSERRPVRTLALNYRSLESDLVWKQVVDVDPGVSSGVDERMRLNIVMSEDEARSVVERIARRIRQTRWKASGLLPRVFGYIQAGDVIATTIGGESIRFRVTRADSDVDGTIMVEGLTESDA